MDRLTSTHSGPEIADHHDVFISELASRRAFDRLLVRFERTKKTEENPKPTTPESMKTDATILGSTPESCFVNIRQIMAPITPVTELNHMDRRIISRYLSCWRLAR